MVEICLWVLWEGFILCKFDSEVDGIVFIEFLFVYILVCVVGG